MDSKLSQFEIDFIQKSLFLVATRPSRLSEVRIHIINKYLEVIQHKLQD